MAKLQDILSGLKQIGGKAASSAVKDTAKKLASEKPDDSLWGKLKSFAKSDTGKTLGMAVGTIAAGRYGGAEGINALTSAIEKSRMKKKEEEREAERQQDLKETRDLRKVNMARAELDLERGREDLNAKKNQNYADLQQKIMSAGMGLPQVTGKKTGSESGEPKLPQPPQPTPVSIDDPEAVQNGEIDAAKWAAKVIQAMDQNLSMQGKTPLTGSGREGFLKNREMLNQELQSSGLTKEQQAAAWKEMSRLIVGPEYFSQYEAMQNMRANPNYTKEEQGSADETNLFKTMTSFPGPVLRGMLGATGTEEYLPDYDVLGQGARDSIQDAASKAWDGVASFFSGQADAVSTPAVAGANKSAAEDMATYQADTGYAVSIANNLMRQGLNADVPSIMDQLSKIPEVSDNKERRDKILKLIQQRFIANARMGGQWTNQRAWR
jgi:hypothetical protein